MKSGTARIRPLDGLRGVAALMVVGFHYLSVFPSVIGVPPVPGAWLGFSGVEVFFEISGFVILMSLQRGSIVAFARARIIRLFPAYWACMALTVFVISTIGLGAQVPSAGQIALNLTMLNKFFGVNGVDGSYWTLAAELAFYVQAAVLYALGLLSSRRIGWTLIAWVAMAGCIGHLLPGQYQALGFADHGGSTIATVGHIMVDFTPFFALGIVALLVFQGHRGNVIIAAGLLCAGVMAVAGTPFSGRDQAAEVRFTAGIIAFAVILIVVLFRPFGTDSSPLRFLGRISYALYLLHAFIGYAVMSQLTSHSVPFAGAAALTFVSVLALATAVTLWFDEPARRWLSGLHKRNPARSGR